MIISFRNRTFFCFLGMSACGSFDCLWLDGFVSSLLACDQAHFCEFGEKFGGGASSAQGKDFSS